jgi:uncharacterized protein (DUF4415 family)
MKTIYHKIPKEISKTGLKQLEKLKKMNDADIDYSDISPLNNKQLEEIAYIVKQRKERMSSITLRLPPKILDKYRELGKGYTSVMAHILCEYINENNGV